MIKMRGNEKIAEKDFYISWERELSVSKEAARITHFSPTKHKKKAIPHKEVFPTIKDWLDNCDYIIGHNFLGFDLYLIRDYYQHMGHDYTHLTPKVIDTNCIARGLKYGLFYKRDEDFLTYQYKILHTKQKGVKSSLTALGKEYEIPFDESKLHEALYDLELNIRVWDKIKWHIDI
jgi:DNA polymerase III epsilon subunit-like protein